MPSGLPDPDDLDVHRPQEEVNQGLKRRPPRGLRHQVDRGVRKLRTGCTKTPEYSAPFTPAVEVGWRLARSQWGKGYATEAARAAVTYGFADLGLDEIVSFTTVGNLRSRAVMERLGMTHDPADDFDHPRIEADHPLRRHVLYRLRSDARCRERLDVMKSG